jgi:hypothetical protein
MTLNNVLPPQIALQNVGQYGNANTRPAPQGIIPPQTPLANAPIAAGGPVGQGATLSNTYPSAQQGYVQRAGLLARLSEGYR